MPQETNPRVRQTIAEVAVEGTKFTGEILPRYVYELAGAPVPPEATDELQQGESTPTDTTIRTKLKHWWRRNWNTHLVFDD